MFWLSFQPHTDSSTANGRNSHLNVWRLMRSAHFSINLEFFRLYYTSVDPTMLYAAETGDLKKVAAISHIQEPESGTIMHAIRSSVLFPYCFTSMMLFRIVSETLDSRSTAPSVSNIHARTFDIAFEMQAVSDDITHADQR